METSEFNGDTPARRGVSVVVPCYNSSARLPATLAHLSRQLVSSDVDWEVIVIDNASTDRTADVARSSWAKYETDIPFRVVPQPVPGLSAARVKGFESARFDYVLFCDDDNWLREDYVERAFRIMESNPGIGALGGLGEAHFSVTPPQWFDRYHGYYAVGPQAPQSGDITWTKGHLYGAGFVIRKAGWERLLQLGFDFLLTDRRGAALTNGGDMELCLALRLLGYQIWYDEDLSFKHYITRGRLSWSYFLRLVSGAHEGVPIMEAYRYALSTEGSEGTVPSKFRWIRECLQFEKTAAKKYKVLILSSWKEMEGHRGQKALYEWKGRMKGWLMLRSRYAMIAERLIRLKASEAISPVGHLQESVAGTFPPS